MCSTVLDLLPLCPLGFVSLRTPLAPSPLWAPLVPMGTVKRFNAAAGYLKKRAVAVARTAPRDDGLAPRDFLHCFGSASAVSYRLQSCVATG
jgi:hypothetical protein